VTKGDTVPVALSHSEVYYVRKKLFRKDGNYFVIEINEVIHEIEIKASFFSNRLTILVDNNMFIEDIIPWNKGRTIYRINIEDAEVIVEVKGKTPWLEIDIFVNSFSIKTGFHIDKEKLRLQENVSMGLYKYLLKNIKVVFKAAIVFLACFFISYIQDLYEGKMVLDIKVGTFLIPFYIFSSFLLSICWNTFEWFSDKRKLLSYSTDS
jgi:hypothetical protein